MSYNSSLPPGWTPERPSPLPVTPSSGVAAWRRPEPPSAHSAHSHSHAPATPSPLSPFCTTPPQPQTSFFQPAPPKTPKQTTAFPKSHYYRAPRSTLTSPCRTNYSSPSVSPTRNSRRARIQALLATDPLLSKLTPSTIREMANDSALGFSPEERAWSLRAAEGIIKVGEWLREVEGWTLNWGRGKNGEGYLPPEPGMKRKKRKERRKSVQETTEAEDSPLRRKSPDQQLDTPRRASKPLTPMQLKMQRRAAAAMAENASAVSTPTKPAIRSFSAETLAAKTNGSSVPSTPQKKLSFQIDEPSSDEEEEVEVFDNEEYYGSLPRSTILRYEARIKDISEQVEELDVDGLKGKVLSYRTGIDNPLTSSSAVITAVTLQLLPPLHRLVKMLSLWSIRLGVLKIVPVFLRWLDNAKTALEAGYEAIRIPAIANGTQKLDEDIFAVMSENIQQRVATAGRLMDTMLDALEGREDVLPDKWIGQLEEIEEGVSNWEMDGERVVLEGRLHEVTKAEEYRTEMEKMQLVMESERAAEEAREDEEAVDDVLEKHGDIERGLMEALEAQEDVQQGIEIEGQVETPTDSPDEGAVGLGLDKSLLKRLREVQTSDIEADRGRRWSRRSRGNSIGDGFPLTPGRESYNRSPIASPSLDMERRRSEAENAAELERTSFFSNAFAERLRSPKSTRSPSASPTLVVQGFEIPLSPRGSPDKSPRSLSWRSPVLPSVEEEKPETGRHIATSQQLQHIVLRPSISIPEPDEDLDQESEHPTIKLVSPTLRPVIPTFGALPDDVRDDQELDEPVKSLPVPMEMGLGIQLPDPVEELEVPENTIVETGEIEETAPAGTNVNEEQKQVLSAVIEQTEPLATDSSNDEIVGASSTEHEKVPESHVTEPSKELQKSPAVSERDVAEPALVKKPIAETMEEDDNLENAKDYNFGIDGASDEVDTPRVTVQVRDTKPAPSPVVSNVLYSAPLSKESSPVVNVSLLAKENVQGFAPVITRDVPTTQSKDQQEVEPTHPVLVEISKESAVKIHEKSQVENVIAEPAANIKVPEEVSPKAQVEQDVLTKFNTAMNGRTAARPRTPPASAPAPMAVGLGIFVDALEPQSTIDSDSSRTTPSPTRTPTRSSRRSSRESRESVFSTPKRRSTAPLERLRTSDSVPAFSIDEPSSPAQVFRNRLSKGSMSPIKFDVPERDIPEDKGKNVEAALAALTGSSSAATTPKLSPVLDAPVPEKHVLKKISSIEQMTRAAAEEKAAALAARTPEKLTPLLGSTKVMAAKAKFETFASKAAQDALDAKFKTPEIGRSRNTSFSGTSGANTPVLRSKRSIISTPVLGSEDVQEEEDVAPVVKDETLMAIEHAIAEIEKSGPSTPVFTEEDEEFELTEPALETPVKEIPTIDAPVEEKASSSKASTPQLPSGAHTPIRNVPIDQLFVKTPVMTSSPTMAKPTATTPRLEEAFVPTPNAKRNMEDEFMAVMDLVSEKGDMSEIERDLVSETDTVTSSPPQSYDFDTDSPQLPRLKAPYQNDNPITPYKEHGFLNASTPGNDSFNTPGNDTFDDSFDQSFDDYDDFEPEYEPKPLTRILPPHLGRGRGLSLARELPSIIEAPTPQSTAKEFPVTVAARQEAAATPTKIRSPVGSVMSEDMISPELLSEVDFSETDDDTFRSPQPALRPLQRFFVSPPQGGQDSSFDNTPINLSEEQPSLLSPLNRRAKRLSQNFALEDSPSINSEASSERRGRNREETPEVSSAPRAAVRPRRSLPNTQAMRSTSTTRQRPDRSERDRPWLENSVLSQQDSEQDGPRTPPRVEMDLDMRISELLNSLPQKVKLTASNLQKLNEQSNIKRPSRFGWGGAAGSSNPGPKSVSSEQSSGKRKSSQGSGRFQGGGNREDIKCYHLHRNDDQPPMKLYVRLVGDSRLVCRVGGGWSDLEAYLKEWATHHGSKMRAVSESRLEIQDANAPTYQRSIRPMASNTSFRSPSPSPGYRAPSRAASRAGSPSVGSVRSSREVTPPFQISARPSPPDYFRSDSPTSHPRSSSPSSNQIMRGGYDGTHGRSRSRSSITPTSGTFPPGASGFTPPSPHSPISRPMSSGSSMGLRRRSSRLSFGESINDDLRPQLGLAGPKSKTSKQLTSDHQAWVEGMIHHVRKASNERFRAGGAVSQSVVPSSWGGSVAGSNHGEQYGSQYGELDDDLLSPTQVEGNRRRSNSTRSVGGDETSRLPMPRQRERRDAETRRVFIKRGDTGTGRARVGSVSRPSSSAGGPPSTGLTRPPSSAGTRPSTSAGTRPSTSAGNRPGTAAGSRPGTATGKATGRPQTASGLPRPPSAGGFRPTSSGGPSASATTGIPRPPSSGGSGIARPPSSGGIPRPPSAAGYRPPSSGGIPRPPSSSSGGPTAPTGIPRPPSSGGIPRPPSSAGHRLSGGFSKRPTTSTGGYNGSRATSRDRSGAGGR